MKDWKEAFEWVRSLALSLPDNQEPIIAGGAAASIYFKEYDKIKDFDVYFLGWSFNDLSSEARRYINKWARPQSTKYVNKRGGNIGVVSLRNDIDLIFIDEQIDIDELLINFDMDISRIAVEVHSDLKNPTFYVTQDFQKAVDTKTITRTDERPLFTRNGFKNSPQARLKRYREKYPDYTIITEDDKGKLIDYDGSSLGIW